MKIENDLGLINSISYEIGVDNKKKVPQDAASSFESFYKAALDLVSETNAYQNEKTQSQLDFITGKEDNVISVMMAQEKAYSSLQFTVQLTNKIVEAYREIMRIQL